MEFCIISPTAGLSRYSTLSKRHLVLPQIKSPLYRDFYVKRRKQGDHIILDNGAYEKTPQFAREFWECMALIRPQVAVLPDYLLQPWKKTRNAVLYFIDQYVHDWPEVEWMFVPQAEKGDIRGFYHCFNEVMHEASDVISWVGAPRVLNSHFGNARADFAATVRQRYPNHRIHALGDIIDRDGLAKMGVTSLDSSAPVWRGWCRYNILHQGWKTLDVPCNFEADDLPEPGDYRDRLILKNLEIIGVPIRTG